MRTCDQLRSRSASNTKALAFGACYLLILSCSGPRSSYFENWSRYQAHHEGLSVLIDSRDKDLRLGDSLIVVLTNITDKDVYVPEEYHVTSTFFGNGKLEYLPGSEIRIKVSGTADLYDYFDGALYEDPVVVAPVHFAIIHPQGQYEFKVPLAKVFFLSSDSPFSLNLELSVWYSNYWDKPGAAQKTWKGSVNSNSIEIVLRSER